MIKDTKLLFHKECRPPYTRKATAQRETKRSVKKPNQTKQTHWKNYNQKNNLKKKITKHVFLHKTQ